MRDRPLQELETALAAAGVCNRDRLLEELEDHLTDLRLEAEQAGYSAEEAIGDAHQRLGTNATLLAAAVSACGAGLEYQQDVLIVRTDEWRRWSAAVCGGAMLTTLMFLGMQVAIHAG